MSMKVSQARNDDQPSVTYFEHRSEKCTLNAVQSLELISLLASSLNTLFNIFPLAVFGMLSNFTPPANRLYFAVLSSPYLFTSASVS